VIKGKKILLQFLFISMGLTHNAKAQNNALVLNGAYITISNGTWVNPVYLVVNGNQPSAIVRNSGHIISEKEGNYIQWNTSDVTVATDYIFPLGYSTTDYLPVTIHKSSVGVGAGHIDNSSSFKISTWSTATDNTSWANTVTSVAGPSGANAVNSAIDRWWQVLAGTNVSGTMDLTYRGAENTTAIPLGLFNAQQWDAATLQYLTPSGSGNGVTSGTGIISGISLLTHGLNTSSPYIISSTSSPLPIELVDFKAECDQQRMNIKWTTASENNVVNIELQKSTDLNLWSTIYSAMPSNSNHNTNYNFTYEANEKTTVYFRLRTNNNDGQSDLSAIFSAQPCNSNEDNLTAFFYNDNLAIHTHFISASTVNYSIYDLTGKKVFSGEYEATEGEQIISVPLEYLSNAIYIFRAESNGKVYNQKIIIANK
jgi:hypothetical protein